MASDASPREKLRYYREKSGISSYEFGKLCGLSEYGVTNYEKGFNEIYYEQAQVFADALNIEINELLDEYTLFCKAGYGSKIKALRESYGLTQTKFAEILGVTRHSISLWEIEYKNHHPSRMVYNKIKSIAKNRGVDLFGT